MRRWVKLIKIVIRIRTGRKGWYLVEMAILSAKKK